MVMVIDTGAVSASSNTRGGVVFNVLLPMAIQSAETEVDEVYPCRRRGSTRERHVVWGDITVYNSLRMNMPERIQLREGVSWSEDSTR